MTTNFLDNKICTFKILLSWRFPQRKKNSVFQQFSSLPQAPPPSKAQILFLLSSRRLLLLRRESWMLSYFLLWRLLRQFMLHDVVWFMRIRSEPLQKYVLKIMSEVWSEKWPEICEPNQWRNISKSNLRRFLGPMFGVEGSNFRWNYWLDKGPKEELWKWWPSAGIFPLLA